MSKKLKIKIDKEFEKMSILGYDVPPLGGYEIGYTYNSNTSSGPAWETPVCVTDLNNLKDRVQTLEVAQVNNLQKISSLESRIIELEKVINDKAWETLYR